MASAPPSSRISDASSCARSPSTVPREHRAQKPVHLGTQRGRPLDLHVLAEPQKIACAHLDRFDGKLAAYPTSGIRTAYGFLRRLGDGVAERVQPRQAARRQANLSGFAVEARFV